MKTSINRADIVEYSAFLGKNPMLVQGAGGNVSWKDNDTLWIKASGTWLEQAQEKNIFVPLKYSAAKEQAALGIGDYSSCVEGDSSLRPSIETALHALLPQKVVVHCHAIDIIVYSVQKDGREKLDALLEGVNWLWIDYVKPGTELARAVYDALQDSVEGPPDVIVLGNHGLVVAGQDVASVDRLLEDVLSRTRIDVETIELQPIDAKLIDSWSSYGYSFFEEASVQSLAVQSNLLDIVKENWVLYPDHAVFLGAQALVVSKDDSPEKILKDYSAPPVCIFVQGVGVMVSDHANSGQMAMIQCYADVVHRLKVKKDIVGLNNSQVAELLDWDAEKYRQQLNAK